MPRRFGHASSTIMGRNRRSQSGAVRLVPAFKTFLLCVFIGGAAVGYVLQKNKIYQLGRQIQEREMVLDRLKWDNAGKAAFLEQLQTPARLAQRAKLSDLGLGETLQWQLIWLTEPARSTNRAPEPEQRAETQRREARLR
jgi:hypothetical protein